MQYAISISAMPGRLSNTDSTGKYRLIADTLSIIGTETVRGVICPLQLASELELSPGTSHRTPLRILFDLRKVAVPPKAQKKEKRRGIFPSPL